MKYLYWRFIVKKLGKFFDTCFTIGIVGLVISFFFNVNKEVVKVYPDVTMYIFFLSCFVVFVSAVVSILIELALKEEGSIG